MKVDWIAADWGTSRLRVWAMSAGAPGATATSDDGMGGLASDEFEAALLSLIDPWLDDAVTTVIACGMVGARQGWMEAPYRAVPCEPAPTALVRAPARDPRIDVWIAPGLSQTRPADVMRGEETQIAGLLSGNPKFDGVLCLPGTHTKWAHISAGEVVSFRTFMTGEIFALLASQSVLRHSIGDGRDDQAFAEAIGDAMAKPEAVAARLFAIRAEGLLAGLDPAAAQGRLSGFLIGMELAAARPYWLGRNITLIGDPRLTSTYGAALKTQGIDADHLGGDEMSLSGLVAARQSMAQSRTST